MYYNKKFHGTNVDIGKIVYKIKLVYTMPNVTSKFHVWLLFFFPEHTLEGRPIAFTKDTSI